MASADTTGMYRYAVDPVMAFIQAVVLTASNPVTILFWAGVFSAKAAVLQRTPSSLCGYMAGCAAATASFLSSLSLLAGYAGPYLSPAMSAVLNGIIGVTILGYGLHRGLAAVKQFRQGLV
ncbi:LysE family transporter [uncultured Megasphaera sp.]|uniref:LysE family transporter n=1 Tax=uncultured Megasphaera sp. TaxID=165188 RepID=UPI0026584B79|nr:LysE family transporter [uncultured Megasphaera sp.]